MEHKYKLLISILDKIRKEAPSSYKTYHAEDNTPESINKSRSLAFIHLLLKVRFGLSNFIDRHKLITDGPQDGGLDAYFIDSEQKKVYLVQSKFRANEKNFETKSIDAMDLLKMDVQHIIKGHKTDINGEQFNEKIINFQNELKKIRDIAKYDYVVVFLCNVNKLNDEQIRRLIDNCEYEIYDHSKAYNNFLFPLTTGTHFDPEEIVIRLELVNKEHPRLKQLIETDFGKFNVTVIFVPTKEIGKIMSKYKNAILKYNPRNFLALKRKSVNEQIKKSITERDKNNFALLNNGITILSSKIDITESTGTTNEGQLILTRPQILNGGQTAYTLSTIYDEFLNKSENPLDGKEVLVKIITPIAATEQIDLRFIESISDATNQQNEVSEADRRSNHEIQIKLQEQLFKSFGYLYERKSGEFYDGIEEGYIDKSLVIDRLAFIKTCKAYQGEPAAARRTSETTFFQNETFYQILNDVSKFKEMFFSYILFIELENIEKQYPKKTDTMDEYGYSLMYGKWAVVSAIGLSESSIPDVPSEIIELAKKLIMEKLSRWKEFDKYIQEKHKSTKYFKDDRNNFELYYKVNLLDEDVKEFFLQ